MTAAVSIRLVEKFPEPAFANLQRELFAPLERSSPEFAAAVRAERSVSGSVDSALFPAMVRFGAYSDEQLVGWSYGYFQTTRSFLERTMGGKSAGPMAPLTERSA